MAGLLIVFALGAGFRPAAAQTPVWAMAYGWLPPLTEFDWDHAYELSTSNVKVEPAGARLYRLLALARAYAQHTDVPYVWGGSKVGDPESCLACRTCLAGKKRRSKLETRHRACTACQRCGIDCSHFVNQLFHAAGLGYQYASTGEFMRRGRSEFVQIGRDASLAQAGDLLFYRNHVVLLVAKRDGRRGDFVHVSRSAGGDRLGGIDLVVDQDLSHFRGRLLRILRHVALIADPPGDVALSE